MHRRLGPRSCVGRVSHPFSEGLLASGCALVEVQEGMRSPGQLEQQQNIPLGIAGCSLESKGPPNTLKSVGTRCRAVRPGVASGWSRGCCGRRVWGRAGCRVPRGCRRVSDRAGGGTLGPRRWGEAWGGLGMWGWRVWGQDSSALGSAGSDGRLGRAGRACSRVCASTFVCVRASACVALPSPRSLLWGREGMHAGEGLGMLNRDEALGWFLPRRAGSVQASERCPCLGVGLVSSSSKHPLHRARAENLLPTMGMATGRATELHPLPCPCPTGREGASFISNLLSLPIRCFELYILKKQPWPIVCTGEGFGSLL